MKQKKSILIIDDKDQNNEMESISIDLYDKYEINWKVIRTADPSFRQNGCNFPDIVKLKLEIESLYNIYGNFDLVLSDFDLNAKGIVDGLDLIDYIKSIRSNAKIIMYSGNYTDAVRKIINNPCGDLTELQVAEAVSKFISYKLVDCIDRTSYKKNVKEYFEKNKEMLIKDELVRLLREHGDMTFNSCCPKFKGLSFTDIAKEIENDNRSYTDEWVMALLSQTIAYLVKINE